MQLLVQALVSGILIGGVYGLFSMGLSLIFGVMKIVNFAHGDFVMLAMYVAFFLSASTGVDPFVIIPLAAVLFFCAAWSSTGCSSLGSSVVRSSRN